MQRLGRMPVKRVLTERRVETSARASCLGAAEIRHGPESEARSLGFRRVFAQDFCPSRTGSHYRDGGCRDPGFRD